MKNLKRTLAAMLAAALLLTLCGCQREPAEVASVPTETGDANPSASVTTVPRETNPPTEDVTVPPTEDVTVPPDETTRDGYVWVPAYFEPAMEGENFSDCYLYTPAEDEASIVFEALGLTLHLPEQWQGNTQIALMAYSDSAYISVVSKTLFDRYQQYGTEMWGSVSREYGYFDYMLRIYCYPTINDLDAQYFPDWLGGNRQFQYVFTTNSQRTYTGEGDTTLIEIHELRDAIGMDAYNELVGDMICTPEQARKIIELHENVDFFPTSHVPEPYVPEDFELFDCLGDPHYLYRCTGDQSSVVFEELGVTLHIPEAWQGKVDIIIFSQNPPNSADIYVVSKEVFARQRQFALDNSYGGKVRPSYGWFDWMLHLSCVATEDQKSGMKNWDGYLGESESFKYIYTTHTTRKYPGDLYADCVLRLVDAIGQEAYKELVGDMICTPEQAEEIIEIHNIQ